MNTQRMLEMIEEAVEDERKTGRLAKALKDMAKTNHKTPTGEQLQSVVGFIRGYVEHVPYFLEQGIAAARKAGLASEMEVMADQLESYWFTADDVMPDHFGLMGLMDDAYASLTLLQGISDYCRTTNGHPLLQQNLTEANKEIRSLIGEPAATHLDTRVGVTIGQAMVQRLLGQMMNSQGFGGFSFGGTPDPIWGNATMDEMVTARLGAMGYVR